MSFLRRKSAAGLDEDTRNSLSGALVTILDPANPASEAYRVLRTNLFYALVDHPLKVVVLTSPNPREGKSTICANLAVALAQADKKTLLVDCDMRKPMMHKIFGLRNLRGIVDVLAGDRTLREVWQEPLANLKVVTVGPMPPNPAELLESRRFGEFLEQARQEFDYVLMDAPPVGPVSDPAILASRSDGVLLVLDAQSTRRSALLRSMRSLEAVGANVMGTVLNNIKSSRGAYEYTYHY